MERGDDDVAALGRALEALVGPGARLVEAALMGGDQGDAAEPQAGWRSRALAPVALDRRFGDAVRLAASPRGAGAGPRAGRG